ncbi:MAG: hypothetical protein ACXVB9_04920 [Bdellovibrionota bacterium]
MKLVPQWIRQSPVLAWGILFILLSVSVTQYGGTNALSRDAALRAITEGHTLQIDNYRDWTIDWAHAPNGHYYSNKAPGPVFLGLPLMLALDAVIIPLQSHRLDERGRAPQPPYAEYLLLMLWMQIIPFFLLVLYICHRLENIEVPQPAIHFFALAAFFGNTAAIYMNSNFGHGVAGLLFLGAFFFWWEKRYVLAGLFLSWALLCDYGVAFALPFFLIATILRERKIRPLLEIAGGAIPGACVWIWYHTVCFGSPFRTGNQFTNPEQIETLPGMISLWGEYSPLPSPIILVQLLFGESRGILFTQPWMFAVFLLPFQRGTARGLGLLAFGSLAGLLWMNGGFGGWHGGWCVGPRYPSVVYPAMALALALCWVNFTRQERRLLWCALGVALAFRVLVYPFSNLAPEEPLWAYHLKHIPDHLGTNVLRFAMAFAFIGATLYWQRRRREFPFSTKSV